MITYKISNKPLLTENNTAKPKNLNVATGFGGVLQQQITKNNELKFSKHATERLQQRNIHLTKQEMIKLDHAMDTVAKKGIKETLIIMDHRVFIASVKNKTVITVAVEEELKENVFTNIDGAIII
ncbi:flagellar operon protein Flg [Clostridium aceticum]|uniref:Flagellar operon protein Flg n=1 Tax=Clostridium aceticum TaxID=84022 RepID=A0A0D8I7G5_9CLOT|nr:TIGR02530 family flagellar biosynthesis protein [Clostridium aceticum]AKL95477.1 flagellar operon protein Flg [Clostridium aceticum]KJF25962.1 hypothetical protein TZ02_15730 [Clostridium aceticum]